MEGIENTYFEENANRKVSRWRVFQFILFIPLAIVGYALGIAAWGLQLLTLFTVPFTGRVPDFVYSAVIGIDRYRARSTSFLSFALPSWPKFEFPTDKRDPGDYPVSAHFSEYSGRTPRWGPLGLLLAIPHYVWVLILLVPLFVLYSINVASILFRGRLMETHVKYDVAFTTYLMRLGLYLGMINMTRYPSFSLKR